MIEREKKGMSKRVKLGGDAKWEPIDMSDFYKRQKEREEQERIRKQEEAAAEQARIDSLECPLCKSVEKHRHRQTGTNGILGPGRSSWTIEDYFICLGCGVHYSDLKNMQKG
jgi:hypothetical protein